MVEDNSEALHPCCRFAVRENDGAHYVFNMGGRIDANLLDLIPGYSNVRVRFVDNSTMHSDTCSFQRALLEFGELWTTSKLGVMVALLVMQEYVTIRILWI